MHRLSVLRARSTRFSTLVHPFRTLACLLVAVSCGKMQEASDTVADKASDVRESTEQGARSLADKADNWVNLEPMEDRRTFCAAEEGTWAKEIDVTPCIDGQLTITADGEQQTQACTHGEGGKAKEQCAHRDDNGLIYFNDGPSVPNVLQRMTGAVADRADMQAYNRLFWPAGVSHDYCYHHGEATEHIDRITCDRRYVRDLYAACAHYEGEGLDWFRPKVCRQIANGHYSAVRSQGDKPFAMFSSEVAVPAYQPLWQMYGLPGEALDETELEELEKQLARLRIDVS